MKEIKFKKSTSNGMIEGILRVINRDIFFKYNDNEYSKQAIKNFKDKGVDIQLGKGWIKVDLLGERDLIKLGDIEIDTEESDEDIESKLFTFYVSQYKKMGFIVQETQNGS